MGELVFVQAAAPPIPGLQPLSVPTIPSGQPRRRARDRRSAHGRESARQGEFAHEPAAQKRNGSR